MSDTYVEWRVTGDPDCGSLLAPDGSCGVRPSTHEAMLAWTEADP